MGEVSVLTNHLRYTLDEDPLPVTANPATTLKQAERAQSWLLGVYLCEWLATLRAVVLASKGQSWAVSEIERQLESFRGRLHDSLEGSKMSQVFLLGFLQTWLRLTIQNAKQPAPGERSMRWGLSGRDVPMAIVHAFEEADGLDPVVCDGVAQCTMLAAFFCSQLLPDESDLAERISETMFDIKTRELLSVLDEVTPAPEA